MNKTSSGLDSSDIIFILIILSIFAQLSMNGKIYVDSYPRFLEILRAMGGWILKCF